ncbi:MAG: hypothetical protein ACI8UD_001862 [Planctomycetota bacterium]|jgi:hypothetical protein
MTSSTDTNKTEVEPSRLRHGRWCHQTEKQIGEGDVAASYSADVIALEGRVRAPFRLFGWLRATTGISGRVGDEKATCYRLVPLSSFEETPRRYGDKIDQALRDQLGFYHGMAVKHGRKDFVLIGPPMVLVAGEPEPEQADLF